MGDLLIRNFPEDLKRKLAEAAYENRRSLSEEAKDMLRRGVAVAMQEQNLTPLDVYDEFRQEFSDALLSDEEHEDMMRAIGDWRQESLPSKAQPAE
jgi:hypothetical protein